ncbi:hypothetical protein BC941DRAFT_472839 [Chlamydoabsidia padenii]|nr:hypothetical protein BC941DRAFT_472839 [Chlamydoabsidia padenii]
MDNNPSKEMVVMVSLGGSIERLVQSGLDKLEIHPHIGVSAKGKAIQKAITVVEIIKRRMEGTLHQYNILDSESNGDGGEARARLFTHLSKNPIPALESTSTYQPPQQLE